MSVVVQRSPVPTQPRLSAENKPGARYRFGCVLASGCGAANIRRGTSSGSSRARTASAIRHPSSTLIREPPRVPHFIYPLEANHSGLGIHASPTRPKTNNAFENGN
jgi:hypothetical protein